MKKIFLSKKIFLISRNCFYSETIFLNQDKVSYRKDEKRTCEANPSSENSSFHFNSLCQICFTLPF